MQTATSNRTPVPDIAAQITHAMRMMGVAPIPRNYELYYEAYLGSNPQLSKELAALGSRATQEDLDAIGAKPGDVVTVESRRGIISLYARADDGTPRGAVFIPFCFYEAAANLLTNPVLDPVGKIPEFKYCAVKVMRGGELMPRSSYGGGQALAALETS